MITEAVSQGMDSHHEKLGRGKEGFYQEPQRSVALQTPSFQTSNLRNCERRNFYCIKTPSL